MTQQVITPQEPWAHHARRILDRIHEDPRLSPGSLEVEIHGRTAILRGAVKSFDHLQLAERRARSAWVGRRVHNQILIQPMDPARRAEDDAIAAAVLRLLAAQPGGALQGVRVRVRGGMVRLRGEVAAEGDRVLAEGLAVGVQGVRGLRNQILVVPGAGPMDRRLADRLQEHIDRRELRGADLPTILVHQGRVAVRGPMPDRRTLRRLIRISEAVPGAWNHPSERHRDGGDENAKTALGAVPRGK